MTNERLKKVRLALGFTQTELANIIGKTLSAVQKYEAGDRQLDKTTAMVLNFALGVNLEWLETGVGGMFVMDDIKTNYAMIPIYDVCTSAGYGAWVNGEAIEGYYPMPENLISKEFKIKPQNINFLHIQGDSMTPILLDGDLVAIDTSRTEAKKGLYVCRVENDLYVKNVSFQDKIVVLSSENPAYEPILASYDDFALIGAVVWYGRALK